MYFLPAVSQTQTSSPLASSSGSVLYVFSKLISVFSPQRHRGHRVHRECHDGVAPSPPRGERGEGTERLLGALGGLGASVVLLHGWAGGTRRPASSGRPNMTLRHWTPWPAPPLTRLSMAAKTIAVLPSAATPMSMKFDPFTLLTLVVPLESRTDRSPG